MLKLTEAKIRPKKCLRCAKKITDDEETYDTYYCNQCINAILNGAAKAITQTTIVPDIFEGPTKAFLRLDEKIREIQYEQYIKGRLR